MVDIGLNLLSWAMENDMDLNEVESLIFSLVRGTDPYRKLSWNPKQPSDIPSKTIEELAHGVGSDLGSMLSESDTAMKRIHRVISQCSEDCFRANAKTFMDNEGSCIVRLSIAIKASNSTKLRLDQTIVDFRTEDSYTREAVVRFFINGKWVDFDIDPSLDEHGDIWDCIIGKPGVEDFLDGLEIFERGPVALAEHLRSALSRGERPWQKTGGVGGGEIELYTSDQLPAGYSASYRSSSDSEEYDILLTIDGEKTWEIQSTWNGQFAFDVYWVDVDDVWLQLIVQNACETYDIAKKIVDDAASRFAQDEPMPNAEERETVWYDKYGVNPDYDITTHKPYNRPVEPVCINDLLVRSAIRTCGHIDHDIREVIAVICVFAPNTGIAEIAVDAFCCPQCKRYYILESDFEKLRSKGNLCCRVITKTGNIKEFIPRGFANLSEQSLFNSLGYNVGKQEGLSASERRTILDFAIANGLKTQKATISFLQWLIDFNGKRENMGEAVDKWKSDIRYLMSDHTAEVNRVIIDRIFLTASKW